MDSRLLELLDKYILDNKNLKKEYSKKILDRDLYKELFSYLDNGYDSFEENKFLIVTLLDSIYNDSIESNNFYLLLSKLDNPHYNKKNEYRSFITKIRKDYSSLLKDIEDTRNIINRNRNFVNTAYTAKKAFLYRLPISSDKYAVSNLKRIVSYYELSNFISAREAMLCVLDIESHNKAAAAYRSGNKMELLNAERNKKEIKFILKSGYEVIPLPLVYPDRVSSLDRLANEVSNTIMYTDKDKITSLLDLYKGYDIDYNEFNYVIASVLNNYNDELVTYSELLLDDDVIFRRNNRNEILSDYYNNLSKYLIVREYFNSVNDFSLEVTNEDDIDITEEKEIKEYKRLIYSTSPANPTKAKIIGDMGDVPHEYYDTVLDLLSKFKDGTIAKGEVKHLTNNKKLVNYMELKRDQVRIVFKHIKGDIYNIKGVFVKKTDNDNTMYQIMATRSMQDISTDDKLNRSLALASYTEEELISLVKEKGRKGTR